jgi:hypothetical protein
VIVGGQQRQLVSILVHVHKVVPLRLRWPTSERGSCTETGVV